MRTRDEEDEKEVGKEKDGEEDEAEEEEEEGEEEGEEKEEEETKGKWDRRVSSGADVMGEPTCADQMTSKTRSSSAEHEVDDAFLREREEREVPKMASSKLSVSLREEEGRSASDWTRSCWADTEKRKKERRKKRKRIKQEERGGESRSINTTSLILHLLSQSRGKWTQKVIEKKREKTQERKRQRRQLSQTRKTSVSDLVAQCRWWIEKKTSPATNRRTEKAMFKRDQMYEWKSTIEWRRSPQSVRYRACSQSMVWNQGDGARRGAAGRGGAVDELSVMVGQSTHSASNIWLQVVIFFLCISRVVRAPLVFVTSNW